MTEKSGSWSPVEIDNLITLVSERRDLYDQSSSGYSNLNTTDTLWRQISSQFPNRNEESDQNTEEYNSQTNPHVDDETYSPSVSDAPSTPEGPTSGSRKKRKSKLNPVDERFLTFFEKKHESTAKREKSSNELFLASLLEDMNKLQQDDLRKFKIIMLSKLGEFLDKYI
ncbi:hypothetical protein RI129_011228 [Pyrocoelia pectoralis]|uniref:MADF domain-containing protein n=1 Tax=Pyrocoelia pectoralis TaxID=417401 RepID=A0AAN7ZFA5_9COLE